MNGVRHQIKVVLGSAAGAAFPHLSQDGDPGRNHDTEGLLKRLVTYSRVHRAARAKDEAGVEAALRQFWKGGGGDRFHANHRHARYHHFLEHHTGIIEELVALVAADPARFSRLIEVGCGDGHVLRYAAERLPEIPDFVGIDLSARAIRDAEAATGDPRCRFVVGDAVDWLAAQPRAGTTVITACGVLEYFAPARVAEVFAMLADRPPAAVVLIEPLAPGHDITLDRTSRIFGREQSFSHPYPALLYRSGFDILSSREFQEGGTRWIVLLAVSEGDAGP